MSVTPPALLSTPCQSPILIFLFLPASLLIFLLTSLTIVRLSSAPSRFPPVSLLLYGCIFGYVSFHLIPACFSSLLWMHLWMRFFPSAPCLYNLIVPCNIFPVLCPYYHYENNLQKLFTFRHPRLVHGNHFHVASFYPEKRQNPYRKYLPLDVPYLRNGRVFGSLILTHKKMAYRPAGTDLCHSDFFGRIFQRTLFKKERRLPMGLQPFKMEYFPCDTP